jgi:hypothetical protein
MIVLFLCICTSFASLYSMHTSCSYLEKYNEIEKKFSHTRTILKHEEYTQLEELKNFYQINDNDWNWCLKVRRYISIALTNCIKKSFNGKHDEKMTVSQTTFLDKSLRAFDFESKNFTFNTDSTHIYEARITSTIKIRKNGYISFNIDQPRLIFPPDASKYSLLKLVLYLNYLCNNHGLFYGIYLKQQTGYDYSFHDIAHNPLHNNLFKKQEKIWILLKSLNNYRACTLLSKAVRKTLLVENENISTELREIKRLWNKKFEYSNLYAYTALKENDFPQADENNQGIDL